MESAQMATQCKVDGGTRPQITASAKDMWHQAMAAAEIAEKQPPEWNCSIQKVSFPNKNVIQCRHVHRVFRFDIPEFDNTQ